MSEGVELQELELQAFRDEIKKLAQGNESLSLGVKNFNDLGEEEAGAWKMYKYLFNEAYKNLDQCQSLDDVKEKNAEFVDCLKKLEELNQFISAAKKPLAKEAGAGEKDKNRLEFLAWLDNLLVLKSNMFSLIHDLDFLEESDLVKMKASMDNKKASLLL